MNNVSGGLIGGILGFSVAVFGQITEVRTPEVLEPEIETRSPSRQCVRVYLTDGTFLMEVGPQIEYLPAVYTLYLQPCVLFADGFE